MLDRPPNRLAISVLFVCVFFVSTLSAQSLPVTSPDTPAQEPQPAVSVEKPPIPTAFPSALPSQSLAHQFLSDQKSIWTSPAKIKKSDAKWLLPLVGGTAILLKEDNAISHHFD